MEFSAVSESEMTKNGFASGLGGSERMCWRQSCMACNSVVKTEAMLRWRREKKESPMEKA